MTTRIALLLLALAHALPLAAQTDTRKFDHLRTGFPLTGVHAVTPCESCHIGGRMAGTPKQCDACHRPGTRIAETVMPPRHIPTVEPCENCHRSSVTWAGARFSHVNVAPGTCVSCHNGSTASGLPSGHLATSASCDSCHRTTTWTQTSFDHSSVVAGTCATCHNGRQATGTPRGHMVTTRSCDACHSTRSWDARSYTHLSPAYQPHNASVSCYACHRTRTETIPWRFPAYQPDCAACHAGDFRAGEHKKVDSPQILYTASELRNCSGACHEYTDATFTVIRERRNGPEHRSRDGGF